MEKLLDNLHLKICNELEAISKEDIKTHDQLDIVKDLLESIKNIYEISEHMNVPETKNNMEGASYAMRRSYAAPAGYGIYDPMYRDMRQEQFSQGYSGTSKEEMIEELRKMKSEAPNMEIKQAIAECISKMEK